MAIKTVIWYILCLDCHHKNKASKLGFVVSKEGSSLQCAKCGSYNLKRMYKPVRTNRQPKIVM